MRPKQDITCHSQKIPGLHIKGEYDPNYPVDRISIHYKGDLENEQWLGIMAAFRAAKAQIRFPASDASSHGLEKSFPRKGQATRSSVVINLFDPQGQTIEEGKGRVTKKRHGPDALERLLQATLARIERSKIFTLGHS